MSLSDGCANQNRVSGSRLVTENKAYLQSGHLARTLPALVVCSRLLIQLSMQLQQGASINTKIRACNLTCLLCPPFSKKMPASDRGDAMRSTVGKCLETNLTCLVIVFVLTVTLGAAF